MSFPSSPDCPFLRQVHQNIVTGMEAHSRVTSVGPPQYGRGGIQPGRPAGQSRLGRSWIRPLPGDLPGLPSGKIFETEEIGLTPGDEKSSSCRPLDDEGELTLYGPVRSP